MWCSSRQQPTPRHVAISWARRLKRVFGIEIEGCARCGGRLKVIASIEEPEVIAKILSHLEKTAPDRYQAELPLGARALPSQASLTNSARQGRDGAFELTIPGTSTKRPPDRRIAVLRIQSTYVIQLVLQCYFNWSADGKLDQTIRKYAIDDLVCWVPEGELDPAKIKRAGYWVAAVNPLPDEAFLGYCSSTRAHLEAF